MCVCVCVQVFWCVCVYVCGCVYVCVYARAHTCVLLLQTLNGDTHHSNESRCPWQSLWVTKSLSLRDVSFVSQRGVLCPSERCPLSLRDVSFVPQRGVLCPTETCPLSLRDVSFVPQRRGLCPSEGCPCPSETCPLSLRDVSFVPQRCVLCPSEVSFVPQRRVLCPSETCPLSLRDVSFVPQRHVLCPSEMCPLSLRDVSFVPQRCVLCPCVSPDNIMEWAVLGRVLASHWGCVTRTAICLASLEITLHMSNHPVVFSCQSGQDDLVCSVQVVVAIDGVEVRVPLMPLSCCGRLDGGFLIFAADRLVMLTKATSLFREDIS